MKLNTIKRSGLVLVASLAAMAVLGCNNSDDSSRRFTMAGEEKEIRGTVADAKLTVCGPTPDKPGTCEGTLLVEPPGAGAAGRVPIEVTRDVLLKKNGQTVFLPQLRGSDVVVRYRASKEGPSVATFVEAK